MEPGVGEQKLHMWYTLDNEGDVILNGIHFFENNADFEQAELLGAGNVSLIEGQNNLIAIRGQDNSLPGAILAEYSVQPAAVTGVTNGATWKVSQVFEEGWFRLSSRL